MKNGHDGQNVPEKVGYTRYYEHDGMLRAYANRSMVLAMVFGAIGLSSFAFAVYVRLQPPTVIRVDSEGEAAIVGGTPVPDILAGCHSWRPLPMPLPQMWRQKPLYVVFWTTI